MTEQFPTISQVIGQNTRKLRGQNTLQELATHGRDLGLNWSSGSIQAIERGNFKATIETVAVLAIALDRVRGAKTVEGDLTINDLLNHEGPIALTPKHQTNAARLQKFLAGGTSGTTLDSEQVLDQAMESINEMVDELKKLNLPNNTFNLMLKVEEAGPTTATEERLAQKNNIDVRELRYWSVFLWGQSFEDQRDEIAGKDATPQKKGRVSRTLLDELATAMKGDNRG